MVYLPLGFRLVLLLVAAGALISILRGPAQTRARAILLLNALLLVALLWSQLPLLLGQWGDYYDSLSPAGKLIYPLTRLALAAWIALSTRSLWKQAFS